ncbi:hypothetical protein CBE90_04725 [Pasteurella multocida]|nr:hypothetical protein CBE90_04725 [Pasteurella multocida]PPE95052.1 hypothetical protein CBE91_10250 [Pasteurella multocida]HDR1236520.1 type II toxin-antitoxin system RelB/DinJ family antitoxin [Pasteurella multocida]HDR1501417.1 type II toxin-antitoxin system RelB/DinJ family antitoxin [Pasteurella multocida]
MPKYAVVRAKIPTEIKEQAVEVLNKSGVTQTEVIQAVFRYIATYKEIPFKWEEIVVLSRSLK